jgi:hypothetical protein
MAVRMHTSGNDQPIRADSPCFLQKQCATLIVGITSTLECAQQFQNDSLFDVGKKCAQL